MLANIELLYGPGTSLGAWFGTLCTFCILLGPVSILLLQLWWFHVGLLRRQMTTYKYLTEKQKLELRKKRILEEKKKKAKSISMVPGSERGAVYPMGYDNNKTETNTKKIVFHRSLFTAIFFCFGKDTSNLDSPLSYVVNPDQGEGARAGGGWGKKDSDGTIKEVDVSSVVNSKDKDGGVNQIRKPETV